MPAQGRVGGACCALRMCAAHLEGALQITLDGAYHSPLGAEDGRSLASVEESSGAGHLLAWMQRTATDSGCESPACLNATYSH
jgi:hypothetical protein